MAPFVVFSGAANSDPCDKMSGNVCLAQFLQFDQALYGGGGFAIAPPTVSPRAIAFSDPVSVIPASAGPFAHKTGPPIRTRICRLLI